MLIKTKYNVGQHVWIVYEDRGEVSVYDTHIDSISIEKDGLCYFTTEGNDYKEEYIILYEDKVKLVEKIEDLMSNIHKREEEERNCEVL